MCDLKMGGNASIKCEQFTKNHPMLPSQRENQELQNDGEAHFWCSSVFDESDISCRGESGYLVTFSLSLDITLEH